MRQSELLAQQARLIERSASLRASVHAHAAGIAAPMSNARQAMDGLRALPLSRTLGLVALALVGRKLGPGVLPLLRVWQLWQFCKTWTA